MMRRRIPIDTMEESEDAPAAEPERFRLFSGLRAGPYLLGFGALASVLLVVAKFAVVTSSWHGMLPSFGPPALAAEQAALPEPGTANRTSCLEIRNSDPGSPTDGLWFEADCVPASGSPLLAGSVDSNRRVLVPSGTDVPITAENVDSLVQVASTSVIEPQQIQWSQDGRRLFIASQTGMTEFLVSEGIVGNKVPTSPMDTVLSISPSGLWAVMRNPTEIVLRDLHRELTVLGMDHPINSARFSPDGRTLAVVMDDGSLLQTWDVQTGTKVGEFRNPDPEERRYSVEFHSSGENLAWISPTGGRALNLMSGMFGPPVTFPANLVAITVNPSGQLLVATEDDTVSLWDTSNASMVVSRTSTPALSLSYTTIGELLAFTTATAVELAEPSTFAKLHSLEIEAFDASFSPSGTHLVVIGADGNISVWVSSS